MFSQILELFLSKLVEQTADNALDNVKSIKDFELCLRTLQKNLKSLNAKASDIEEEIKNAELSGRKKRKREVEEWLGEVKSIEREVVELGSQVDSEGFIMRFMDGERTTRLNDEVSKLVEQSRNFGELVLDVCGSRGEIMLTNGMVGKAFNENLNRILELLESRQLSSIGVYGMGGVGKTTLAKHINNQLLKQSETRVIWVTVSQEFTVADLQEKIARFLGVNLLNEDNVDIRASRLHTALSMKKNTILILDDVWENIDMLKVGCSFSSVECCRLIITTRSLEVCRQMRCHKVFRVEELGDDEAWRLFHKTLGNGIKVASQVEKIAKMMVKLCRGLPLGIITVAGSMRGETYIHTWKNALAELKDRVVGQNVKGNDEVYKVLRYSFDRLNWNNQNHYNVFNIFQLCFLYCSLYPEDYKIRREHLVRKFISEGLVDHRKSGRAQVEQGHSILDKLVNVCLLESCVDYDGDECVKMHDLVRGMAMKIGEGKYLVRAGDYSFKEIPDEQEWTKDLEKVSLMMNGIRRIRDGFSPNFPNLSTLLFWGNQLEFIPNSFFSKMQGLCTLDLCSTHIRMLPDSICDMKSLKARLLEKCYRLERVPYLGKLKALRELNLSNTDIKEVPRGLKELQNLKSLSMEADKLQTLPRGLLFKLGHLQRVEFPFHIQVPIEEIENLKQLEEFSGGVKSVNDFNCFITSRVHDTCYRIQVGVHGVLMLVERFFPISRYIKEEEDLGWYDYKNELSLCECNFKVEKVLGQGVVHLTIRECEGLSICFVDDISQINNPTSLKRLTVSRCEGIEWILRSEQESTSKISKTLERIELEELEDLKGVIKRGELGSAQAVFSTLRCLRIVNCNKMRKLGLVEVQVPNLEEISIWGCGEIEEIFEDEGRGSDTLLLPKFKRLLLHDLPRLKSVCTTTMICKSIKEIHIRECPRLRKKLPVHVDVPPPSTLTQIFVEREWWESLKWDNSNLPQLLRPLLRFR